MIIDPYHWHPVQVRRILRESADAVRVEVEKPADYSFIPGQHAVVQVKLDDGTKRVRQYSYSNAPSAKTLEFTITRAAGGEVSSWFIDTCTEGSYIAISQAFTGPLQQFSDYKRIGMVAGGSGLAPMLSILRHLRDIEQSTPRTLLYSTRAASVCATNLLRPISSHEHIVVQISDQDGRMTPDGITAHLHECDVVLICGSRQFVSAMRSLCANSFPDTPIHAEAFSLT